MKTKISFRKIAGALATIVLLAFSLSPNTFDIPFGMRPWIFIFNVLWIITICSGILNS